MVKSSSLSRSRSPLSVSPLSVSPLSSLDNLRNTKAQDMKLNAPPVRTNTGSTCSNLKNTLDRLDISKLTPEDVQSLMNISENKCPDDAFYLNKLYDIIVESNNRLILTVKDNLSVTRMMTQDVKNLKIQNKQLENEKNNLKTQVDECKSTKSPRKNEIIYPQKNMDIDIEEIQIPLTSRNSARRKTPRKNIQKRPWIY
jgi:hypothetical protein